MTGHPTQGASIDDVLDLIDHFIEVLLSLFSALVGFGFGNFLWGVL